MASGSCVACVGACLGGFVGWLSHARAHVRPRSLFGHTLSERRGCASVPHPTGSLTARVRGDSGSAPLWVSTLPSSFVSQCQGLRVRSLTGSSQQRSAPRLRLTPSATPWRFPIQTKGMSIPLTRLFGLHDRTTLTRNHTLSS